MISTSTAVSNHRIAVQLDALDGAVRDLACERAVPVVDLRLALDALPHAGLGPDGVHPVGHRDGAGRLDEASLACGMNARNYVTLRALATLRAVDTVFAEDTRHARALLAHHGIGARVVALHEHNERAAAQKMCRILAGGKDVALVSDAGTPAISDPGAIAVAAVRDAGYGVVPIPGPSAAVAALSVAGMPGPYAFAGFLPDSGAAPSCAGVLAMFLYSTFFLAIALRRGPFRVRAFVCVRCPRTGRLRRCREPR